MIGLRLFLVSRRAFWLLAFLGLLAVAGRLLGPRGYLLGQEAPLAVPWVVFQPLISGYAVAGSSLSPVPLMELHAARRVDLLARGYLALMSGLAFVLLWWSTSPLPPPIGAPAAVRNLLGLLGVALVSVTLFGVTIGWIPPSLMMFGAIVLRGGEVDFLPVTWLFEPDGDSAAWVVAGLLLTIGVIALSSRRFHLRSVDE